NPPLVLRALYFFRWGAMWTFLFGLALFYLIYIRGGAIKDADGGLSQRGMWISFGGLLGTIMWFNVWFVIWPAQKKILGAALGKNPAPDAKVGARATFASRMNVWLSVPMLFVMAAGGGHIYSFSWVAVLIVLAVGFLAAHLFIMKFGPSVKADV